MTDQASTAGTPEDEQDPAPAGTDQSGPSDLPDEEQNGDDEYVPA